MRKKLDTKPAEFLDELIEQGVPMRMIRKTKEYKTWKKQLIQRIILRRRKKNE